MNNQTSTVLITGHSGFIGKYLAEGLLNARYRVRGLDIRPLRPQDDIAVREFIGDILDRENLSKAANGVDLIVHLAAEHKDFGVTKEQYFRVNQKGTENVVSVAEEHRVRNLVFFSSVAVYGEQQGTSEGTPAIPETPYGESKLAAENVIRRWTMQDPSRASLIMRPTVVFGPGNTANIFRLIRQVCDGKFVWVGDGKNVKSVAYVENLVDATIFLLERLKPGIDIYNYADSPHLSTHALVCLIAKKAGRELPSFRIPLGLATSIAKMFDVAASLTGRDFPITSTRLNKFNTPTFHRAEKIRSSGFSPRFTIEEGIEKNVRWYIGEGGRQQNLHNTSE